MPAALGASFKEPRPPRDWAVRSLLAMNGVEPYASELATILACWSSGPSSPSSSSSAASAVSPSSAAPAHPHDGFSPSQPSLLAAFSKVQDLLIHTVDKLVRMARELSLRWAVTPHFWSVFTRILCYLEGPSAVGMTIYSPSGELTIHYYE